MSVEIATLVVRPAREDDREFVIGLMTKALEPYYGGDHKAHAERILNTHLLGGVDRLGFFSTEQRMFLATRGEKPAGLLHLVGKRQGTYKISPLIVSPESQGTGVGQTLLSTAIRHARAAQARQLYCTVAETNSPALSFFLRHGFIRGGISESHYKQGIREIMLYRITDESEPDDRLDRRHISVIPFSEKDNEEVRSFLLERLPSEFSGIDNAWIDALFAGYARRNTRDVNTKYKILYVARNDLGQVCGVSGATPKKGEPIKLMPFVASDSPSFNAMVTDVPYLLRDYGRKVYLHIIPSVDEVILLQRRGWVLDGLLPAGYHPRQTTQQWSLDILNQVTMRHLRVKQQFLNAIRSGRKTTEVRVAYDHMQSLKPGEYIRLISQGDAMVVRVRQIDRFVSFEALLSSVPPEAVAPGRSREDALSLLREIYPPEKEALGVLALSLETPKQHPTANTTV